MLDRLWLFGSCVLPSILFYYCQGAPDPLLALITCLQLLLPLLHDGQGGLIDLSVIAVFAVVMASQMLFYIRGRRNGSDPKQIYEILFTWNDRPGTSSKTNTDDKTTLAIVRHDAYQWLFRAVVQLLLSIPVMSTMDGFLRVCKTPPNDVYIDWRYLYYFAVLGFTLHLHIAIIPLLCRLSQSIVLILSLQFPLQTFSVWLHEKLALFVQQPPLFDKPWLARSVHELWSHRWHQMFRPIFRKIAYEPARALATNPTMGRVLGTFAVFLASGLMHDYIMLTMIGYHRLQQPGLLGYQTLFFIIQALATILSAGPFCPRLPPWIGTLLTVFFVIYTAPIFLMPYLRIGLHLVAEVPGFPRFMDSHIGVMCPYGS